MFKNQMVIVLSVVFMIGMAGMATAESLNVPPPTLSSAGAAPTLTIVFGRPSAFESAAAVTTPVTAFSGQLERGQSLQGSADPQAPGNPIPEPATLMLFGLGLIGLIGWTRRTMRRRGRTIAHILHTGCLVFLALSVTVGGVAAWSEAGADNRSEFGTSSSEKAEEPHQIVTVPPVLRSAAEEKLLHDLTAARMAGDVETSRALQAQVDALYGIVPSSPAQMKATVQTQTGVFESPAPLSEFKWTGDVQIRSSINAEITPSLASAPNGDLYAAFGDETTGYVYIYRSTNGGGSWASWASYRTGSASRNPSLTYIEASNGEKWVYVAYEATSSSDDSRYVMVVRTAAGDISNWTPATVASGISMPSGEHIAPEICTDYPIFTGGIYLYVTYSVQSVDYYPVMFSRSTDRGLTWSTPQNVTGGANNSSWQTKPDITYGTAGLFIAFEKLGWNGSSWTNQVWVTKSAFGSSWDTPVQLTSSTYVAYHPRVSAAIGNNSVLVAYTRDYNNSGDLDIRYAYSTDAGSNWHLDYGLAASTAVEKEVELDRSRSQGNFHAAYWQAKDVMYRAAATTAPSSWSTATLINEQNWASNVYPKPAVTINSLKPTAQEAGIAWTDFRGSSYDVYFDAGSLANQVLWTRSGEAVLWSINPTTGVMQNYQSWAPGSTWTATSYYPMSDGTSRILWTKPGSAVLWTVNSAGAMLGYWSWAPGSTWTATSYYPMADGTSRVLWTKPGQAVLWTVNNVGSLIGYWSWAPGSTWTATGYQPLSGGNSRVLWTRTGEAVLWTVNNVGTMIGYWSWAPGSTWTATGHQPMSDGTSRLLWTKSGQAVLWTLNSTGTMTAYWSWGPGSTWTAQSYYASAAVGGAFTAAELMTSDLAIKKAGTGQGTIVAGEQTCGLACQELRLPYTLGNTATLQVTPAVDSVFAGWETVTGVRVATIYYAQPGDTVIAVFERK